MTFMEKAAMRTECVRLCKFIRLADFQVVDTLRAMASDALTHFTDAVLMRRGDGAGGEEVDGEAPGPEGGMLFRVEVRCVPLPSAGAPATQPIPPPVHPPPRRSAFPLAPAQVSFNKDGELVLDPAGPAFRHAVEKALSDAVRVTDVVPRLLEHESLSPYTTAAEYEAPEDEAGDLHDVVEAESSFQKERTALFAGLRRAFQRVSEYCSVFEPYRVRGEAMAPTRLGGPASPSPPRTAP